MILITRSALLAENTPKPVWRPGSAWTRWGVRSSPPHPLAALRSWDAGRKQRGKGGEEGNGEGSGREEGRMRKGGGD